MTWWYRPDWYDDIVKCYFNKQVVMCASLTLGLVHIFLAKHRHRDSVKKYLTCKIENKIVFRLHFSSYCIQKKKKNCLLVLIMADVNPCVATYIFVSLWCTHSFSNEAAQSKSSIMALAGGKKSTKVHMWCKVNALLVMWLSSATLCIWRKPQQMNVVSVRLPRGPSEEKREILGFVACCEDCISLFPKLEQLFFLNFFLWNDTDSSEAQWN